MAEEGGCLLEYVYFKLNCNFIENIVVDPFTISFCRERALYEEAYFKSYGGN